MQICKVIYFLGIFELTKNMRLKLILSLLTLILTNYFINFSVDFTIFTRNTII